MPPDVPPPRKRLTSADLSGDLTTSTIARGLRELLERTEGLEETAAKASDVREVADQVKIWREQAEKRDILRDEIDSSILRELAATRSSASATATNSRAARFWGKVVAMIGVAGPGLVIAFAQWGTTHPEAFGGLAGSIGLAILAVAKATTPTGSQSGASVAPPPGPT